MRIRFNKTDGFIRIYDGTRYLTLFGSDNYDAIYNGIRYLTSLKDSITSFFSLICKNQSWFLFFFTYRKKIDPT